MNKAERDRVEVCPKKWALKLTRVLDEVMGVERFPVDVEQLALGYSKETCPDDPIVRIKELDTKSCEGALYPAQDESIGWEIGYSQNNHSEGKKRFTLAHEFGHYLMHRNSIPEGIECTTENMLRWENNDDQREFQANCFAANLLMPLRDFYKQIAFKKRAYPELLKKCASRYGVSYTAAALQWLSYTDVHALVVCSRDGYILWSSSSKPAYQSGMYIKTRNVSPKCVPTLSPVSEEVCESGFFQPIDHYSEDWHLKHLEDVVEEHAMHSEQYGISVSLLLLP